MKVHFGERVQKEKYFATSVVFIGQDMVKIDPQILKDLQKRTGFQNRLLRNQNHPKILNKTLNKNQNRHNRNPNLLNKNQNRQQKIQNPHNRSTRNQNRPSKKEKMKPQKKSLQKEENYPLIHPH